MEFPTNYKDKKKNLISINVPDRLVFFISHLNKFQDLNDFLNRIPFEMIDPLQKYFNSLKEDIEYQFLANKLYSITEIKELDWTDYEINPIGRALYNIESKGLGKFETFIVWNLKHSKANGGKCDWDISLDNSDLKIEVKDYLSDHCTSIRLGKDGKITKFNFYFELIKFFQLVNTQDFTLLNDEEILQLLNTLRPKIDHILSGEVSKDARKLLNKIFYKLNKVTSTTEEQYTIFKGLSNDGNHIYLNPTNVIYKFDLKGSDSISYNFEISNLELLIYELRSLVYIKEPSRFYKDLRDSIDEIIQNNKMFIVSRPNKINFTNEFVFDCISQAGIKIIEKDYFVKQRKEELYKAFEVDREKYSKTFKNNLKEYNKDYSKGFSRFTSKVLKMLLELYNSNN